MKADLHLHSRSSDRAPEWFFRRAGVADSYTDPANLYLRLRDRGMDFFTITDHDSIDGCLAIAGRPGVFLSEQVTARFPEDRCVVHVLVWGITEAQHRELQRLRENIFDLQKYLAAEQLAHAVAHPFYRPDDRLTVSHIEKLVLLFKHFEGLNGLRDGRLSEISQEVLCALTPERITELENRAGFAATHPEPWKKIFTGGSDDHIGLAAGQTWTQTPAAADWREFLHHVRAGRCEPGGKTGTPLAVSHTLYNNLGQFIGAKFAVAKSTPLIAKAFSRFMEGEDPTEFSWTDKLSFVAHGIATGQIFELAKPQRASLWKQFSETIGDADLKTILARETAGIVEPERRAFVIADFFANQLAFRFFTSFVRRVSSGNIIEAIQEISVMLPIAATLSPYFYALANQSPDRKWLRQVSHSLGAPTPRSLQNRKRAWFTDTLDDVNGVANTIRRLSAACAAEGYDLTVVTSRSELAIEGFPLKNFPPIGEFELPEYKLQKLTFPPILRMLEYIQREGFTELIISTPGPVGLTALLAARMFGLQTSGIYHTDFPQYVRILSDDSMMETLTWNFMKWFYEQLDLVYVNSEVYRRTWTERGIPAERLAILPRGIDTQLFQPSRRDPGFWSRHGVPRDSVVLLYVGRISREKDLDMIADAWPRLRGAGVALAFVGDGPYAPELRATLPDAIFTGYLAGEELAKAFASADIFLFPSTTDTFGNVILEAMASGLPCIVSDQGGPCDLITQGQTGYITKAHDVGEFTAAIQRLIDKPTLRRCMSIAAREAVDDRDWTEAARRFWAIGLVQD